jgi:hypothetical protein
MPQHPHLVDLTFGWCPASCPFVCNDLLETLDAVRGEDRHATIDAVDPEAYPLGDGRLEGSEVSREVLELILGLAL